MMTFFETSQIVLLLITGIGMPMVLVILNRQDADRRNRFGGLEDSIKHIDDCLDETKKIVISQLVQRGELKELHAELEISINNLREAVGKDTHGLHERIFRLETGLLEKRDV